jgi:Mlc titration factor MtfA (ptsG expression regulator)
MNWLKRARLRYILHRHPIHYPIWRDITGNSAVFQGLNAVEKAHLRELTALFLYDKKLIGVQGQELTDAMRITIAALACLPMLGLDFGCLAGWTEVIVYPAAFRVSHEEMDDAGVVHRHEWVLDGEAWSHGPLILSWDDIERDLRQTTSGRNVVIHEIAHKLDMLNGSANGYPPLHYGMSAADWSGAFSTAYDRLARQVERHQATGIDPYAADNPAEFFAVASEYFFCAPDLLKAEFADVYEQLRRYYRQDPWSRSYRTAQ